MYRPIHLPWFPFTRRSIFAAANAYLGHRWLRWVLFVGLMVAAALALAGVVEQGTAQAVKGAFARPGELNVLVGGKPGSGNNFETFNRYGNALTSRAVNRTATFVFYIGERYFGVITAFVAGPEASRYRFTSALPVAVLKLLAPAIRRSDCGEG
jgi:hypothetical protein